MPEGRVLSGTSRAIFFTQRVVRFCNEPLEEATEVDTNKYFKNNWIDISIGRIFEGRIQAIATSPEC